MIATEVTFISRIQTVITDHLTPWVKLRKYMWFWRDQKIHSAFFNGCLRNRSFEWCCEIEDICLQNDIAEIYFIVERSNLHLSFCNVSGDGSDIYRFPDRKQIGKAHMVIVYFLLENLYISEASPDTVKTKTWLDLSIIFETNVFLFFMPWSLFSHRHPFVNGWTYFLITSKSHVFSEVYSGC